MHQVEEEERLLRPQELHALLPHMECTISFAFKVHGWSSNWQLILLVNETSFICTSHCALGCEGTDCRASTLVWCILILFFKSTFFSNKLLFNAQICVALRPWSQSSHSRSLSQCRGATFLHLTCASEHAHRGAKKNVSSTPQSENFLEFSEFILSVRREVRDRFAKLLARKLAWNCLW